MKSGSVSLAGALVASLLGPVVTASVVKADPPKIVDFRIQEVNQKIFFHLRLERPQDMAIEARRRDRRFDPWNGQWTDVLVNPRLVPQDGSARLVYAREVLPEEERAEANAPVPPQPIAEPKDGKAAAGDKLPRDRVLDFYGIFTGKKEAAFVLLYPKDEELKKEKGKKVRPLLKKLTRTKERSLLELLQAKGLWAEVAIQLDPARAKKVPLPKQGFRRGDNLGPKGPGPGLLRAVSTNDLEGNWALAQATHFALLERQTPEFGFYSFARETTSRLYKVPSPQPAWRPWMVNPINGGKTGGEVGRLYEVTTGAAAITESLALERMRNRGPGANKEELRTIAIGEVRGIDIDEHPWKKMMAGKKPAPEPLAMLVPRDNYYLHFTTITKFLDTGDLLDTWGTPLVRAFEVNSRDYRVKQKLEQQICLRSTGLARTFGPAVLKSLALTGNDPYLREGSDFAILFEVTNRPLFQAGTEPMLAQARKKFGGQLKEDRTDYQGVAIDSHVTPLREVSLHRAWLGTVAVYSNSPVAVRRIIDAHQGKINRLADALDFQYMRTVFRADDAQEDGFVFLSDAFIRNLVGPAVRIKERRRLEALTSLHMLTSGAMYTAWETGKLPRDHQHLLETTGLAPTELFSPDGTAVAWNAEEHVAVSNVYNTLHFATPLVEMPIDRVTPTEAREYEQFRLQYLGLWRRYFDPIGMRFSLRGDQIRWETYILPLVNTTQYNELRRVAGDGTVTFDASVFSDKALVQYLMHVSPKVFGEDLFGGPGRDLMVDLALRSWLGDWFTVRLDDSPIYAKLLESYIRSQMFPEERHDHLGDLILAFKMPVTIGFDVRSPVVFAGLLTGVRKMVENTLPGVIEWGPLKDAYRGFSIVRIKARGEQLVNVYGGPTSEARRFNPTFYYAMIDGAFYLSFQEAPIRDLIDRRIALKEGKGTKIETNATLYLGPKAAVQAKDLLRQYLEWETHRRAQLNNRLLYALFRSNVARPSDDGATLEGAALQYLGFVPVSPDLAPFHYEWQKEEVVNQRHGSLRQPKLHAGVEPGSPLGQLLEQFATIRADLRFREDGIHATLTFRKNPTK